MYKSMERKKAHQLLTYEYDFFFNFNLKFLKPRGKSNIFSEKRKTKFSNLTFVFVLNLNSVAHEQCWTVLPIYHTSMVLPTVLDARSVATCYTYNEISLGPGQHWIPGSTVSFCILYKFRNFSHVFPIKIGEKFLLDTNIYIVLPLPPIKKFHMRL